MFFYFLFIIIKQFVLFFVICIRITGTTDAIFIARQLQERYRGKHRKLWWAFADLEKAFDRVPRKVVEWAMRKLGFEEWLVRAVMAMYKHARTRVRSYGG